MKRRCLAIITVLALLLPLLLGGIVQASDGEAEEVPPAASQKVSGLLSTQVAAKVRALEAGGIKESTPEGTVSLLEGMQAQGLELGDLSMQRIFIHAEDELSPAQLAGLEDLGLILYPESWIPPLENHPTGFLLADMPVDRLEELSSEDFVIRLDTAERVLEAQNDLATQAMNSDDVWTAGYDGSGVTIAVLDSGIDLSHPDFPTPIAIKDYSNWPTLDDTVANTYGVTGHGTHVTGSALGRGTQSGGVYKGSAPGADLVFLKIGKDSTGSASTDAMVYAIRDARDVYNADVITVSYGGWDEYHDGSCPEAQAFDYAVSQGAVALSSAGNSGNDDDHYSGTVAGSSTTDYIQIDVTGSTGSNAGLMHNLVWYDGLGTSNDLELEYYDSTYTLLPDAGRACWQTVQSESSRGTEQEYSGYGPSEGSYYYLPTGDLTYYLKVKNNSSNTQQFHIYDDSGKSAVTFHDPDPFYTIGSPGDADNCIAVGAYTTRSGWWDYNNSYRTFGNPIYQISPFSSRGPRVNGGGSSKPSIVAPGSAILSCRDDDTYPWPGSHDAYVVDNVAPNQSRPSIYDGSGPADYYEMQGTSMSCPHAAGVAALILQANPTWMPGQVQSALESTAVDKGVAGRDDVYGYGLIDALAATSAGAADPPDILVNPTSFEVTLPPDTTWDGALNIGNTGGTNLIYDITDEDTTTAPGETQETVLPTGVEVVEGPPRHLPIDHESSHDKDSVAKDTAGKERADVISGPASITLDFPLERSPVAEAGGTFSAAGWQNIMTDAFEGVFPGSTWDVFAPGDNADAYWGKDISKYQSPSNSIFCAKNGTAGVNPPADYPVDMASWMIYGPFSLADATDAEMNFNWWYDTELNEDYIGYYASTDGFHFYGDRYSGDSGDWLADSFDLTTVWAIGNLCGQPEVWVAFLFQSNSSVGDYGAFIDDVVLRKYTASPGCVWLSEIPGSGTVAASGSAPITVSFDTNGLAAGDYSADIVIASNDPDENPVTVPVTLHVVEPCEVLFEQAHFPAYWTAETKYSDWVTLMESQGMNVASLNTGPVTGAALSGYDVVIISNPTDAYTPDEINAIKQFVSDGGGLFIVGESGGYMTANNVSSNQIATEFGITFNNDQVHDSLHHEGACDFWPLIGEFNNSVIGTDVSEALIYSGCSLSSAAGAFPIAWAYDNATVSSPLTGEGASPSGSELSFSLGETTSFPVNAQPEAFGDGPVVMAAATYGSGRVAAVGDGNPFDNMDTDGDATMNLYERDNEKVAVDIPEWLCGYGASPSQMDIPLVADWNLVSLPLIPDNTDINAVISAGNLASGNPDNIEMVYTFNTTTETWMWWNRSPASTLNTMEDGRGYWFYTTAADTLTAHGTEAGHPGPDYPVLTGWDMIGFTSTGGTAPESYLASVVGKYTMLYRWDNGGWLWWMNGNPASTFANMEPGYGYWLYMTADGTITPP